MFHLSFISYLSWAGVYDHQRDTRAIVRKDKKKELEEVLTSFFSFLPSHIFFSFYDDRAHPIDIAQQPSPLLHVV